MSNAAVIKAGCRLASDWSDPGILFLANLQFLLLTFLAQYFSINNAVLQTHCPDYSVGPDSPCVKVSEVSSDLFSSLVIAVLEIASSDVCRKLASP